MKKCDKADFMELPPQKNWRLTVKRILLHVEGVSFMESLKGVFLLDTAKKLRMVIF